MSLEDLTGLLFDLKDYSFEEQIGEGVFGRVTLVRNISTGKHYALKQSKKKKFTVEEQKLFVREIATLVAANHPCTLKLVGFSFPLDKSPDMLLTEYLPFNLENALKNKYDWFDATTKMKIAAGLAAGLAHLHSHKIVHRDLKPANILINENHETVIADFGLSRPIDTSGKPGTVAGTPLYMAPEVFNGSEPIPSIDIFGLGVILYELLCNESPFKGVGTFSKWASGARAPFPEGTPAQLQDLISRCWSINSENRPSAYRVFKALKEDGCIINGVNRDVYLSYFESLIDVTEPDYDPISLAQMRLARTDRLEQYNFAIRLINEEGDYQQAVKYLEKSYMGGPDSNTNELPNLLTIHQLGFCYLRGKGTAKDEKRACKLFKEGAERMSVPCLYEYGKCLRDSIGTEQNVRLACIQFDRAAMFGNLDSVIALAKIYKDGHGTVKRNKSMALMALSYLEGCTSQRYLDMKAAVETM